MAKASVYNETQKEEHLRIRNLFDSEEQYYRHLLGNYHLSSDIIKRPLAKLTQDIAKQLKLKK